MLPLNLAWVGLVPYCSVFSFLFSLGDPFTEMAVCQGPTPWGLFVPPSLTTFSLCPCSGLVPGLSCCHCCCSWPSSATVFHQNTKPQWSIQAQARSSAAPPSHPTLFWLCLLSPFLPPCKFNGPVQEEVLAQTFIAGSKDLNELRKIDSWALSVRFQSAVFTRSTYHL